MLGIFENIDPNTLIYTLIFLIFFALIYFALMRVFKQKPTSAVIAICASLLAVYGIDKAGLDILDWFYGIGLSENMLYIVVPILILTFLIFLIKKIGFGLSLMVMGGILLALTFTDLIYQKSITLIVGILLLAIGLKLWMRKRKKEKITNMNWWEKQQYAEKQRRNSERIENISGAIGRGLGKAYGRAKYNRQQEKAQKREEQVQKRAEEERQQQILERAKNIEKIRKERFKQEKAEKENQKQMRREQTKRMLTEQITNRISNLQQMVPNASVIERGRIEDEIKKLNKQLKKL